MDSLMVMERQLPDALDELSRFALVGREKLKSVRAEISAIQKVGLAKEVLEQKKKEAQEIAELVTLSEMRIGVMLLEIPKESGGDRRSDIFKIRTSANFEKPTMLNNSVSVETHTPAVVSDAPKEAEFVRAEPPKPVTKAEVLREIKIPKDTASRFQRMAQHPEVVHAAIEEARKNDDIVSRAAVMTKIKQHEREEHRREKAERKAYSLPDELPDDMCRLFAADIRGGLPEIESESVDYIITDPPYPKEYIPLYGDLSRIAARVLKPGGSLIVMTGQSYLPEVIAQLSECMTYHWFLSYLTPGGQSPQLFHKRVNTFWKPLLWYVKGAYSGDYIGDVLKSPPNDNDKRFHEWGQSLGGMKDILERFTNPGDIVLDPFLGGGTTGVAAVSMGRKFVGTDIDGKNVETAKQRIMEAFANARSTG